MPVPQQLARGSRMGRGPYEKSGLVEDTSLPPLRTLTFSDDIFYPVHDQETDDGVVRTFPSDTLEIEVKLWYLPFGTMESDPFLWHEFKKKVAIQAEGR
jgi:hypothetical protein